LWGDADYVKRLLADRVTDVRAVKERVRVDRCADPEAFCDYFKARYGPTVAACRGLAGDSKRVAALDRDLADRARRHNRCDNGFDMDWDISFSPHALSTDVRVGASLRRRLGAPGPSRLITIAHPSVLSSGQPSIGAHMGGTQPRRRPNGVPMPVPLRAPRCLDRSILNTLCPPVPLLAPRSDGLEVRPAPDLALHL